MLRGMALQLAVLSGVRVLLFLTMVLGPVLTPTFLHVFPTGGAVSVVTVMSLVNFSKVAGFPFNWRTIQNLLASLTFAAPLPVTVLRALVRMDT